MRKRSDIKAVSIRFIEPTAERMTIWSCTQSAKGEQMAKKTPAEKFEASVKKILEEYGDDVKANVSEITESVGKAGVTMLRQESRAKFNGKKYASGWTSQTEKTRLSTRVIIYNKKPGLPHLLEKGHAKRGGGRVAGRVHIAPVEEDLINTIQREVEAKV